MEYVITAFTIFSCGFWNLRGILVAQENENIQGHIQQTMFRAKFAVILDYDVGQ